MENTRAAQVVAAVLYGKHAATRGGTMPATLANYIWRKTAVRHARRLPSERSGNLVRSSNSRPTPRSEHGRTSPISAVSSTAYVSHMPARILAWKLATRSLIRPSHAVAVLTSLAVAPWKRASLVREGHRPPRRSEAGPAAFNPQRGDRRTHR